MKSRKIQKINIFAVLIVAILLIPSVLTSNLGIQPAAARTYFITLYPESDTYITDPESNKNYGARPFIELGSYTWVDLYERSDSLVRFDLTQLYNFR